MVFFILHIFPDPIWGLGATDNVYLTLSLHEFLCENFKIKILGTDLLRITF